jgi:hypothetical protein
LVFFSCFLHLLFNIALVYYLENQKNKGYKEEDNWEYYNFHIFDSFKYRKKLIRLLKVWKKFMMFDSCVDINDEHRLIADLEIICWEGHHLALVLGLVLPFAIFWCKFLISLLFIFLKVVLFPIYLTRSLFYKKQINQLQFRFLHFGYRPAKKYW